MDYKDLKMKFRIKGDSSDLARSIHDRSQEFKQKGLRISTNLEEEKFYNVN